MLRNVSRGARRSAVAGLALVLALVAVGFSPGSSSAPAGATAPTPLLASPSSSQWAFGGSAFSTFSCSSPACLLNISNSSTTSVSWRYFAEWVVLYTQTNVSPTQVEMNVRAALNVTLSYRVTMCLNVSISGPCVDSTISLAVAGRQTATGTTNLTNGTVAMTAGPGSPGSVAAWAATNASCYQAFNFSGNYALQSSTSSGSANFDVGGWQRSSIDFASPLGVVPMSPVPGNAWTASAPFSATGRYVSGYSYTLSAPGTSLSRTNWTPGSVTPSGTLNLSGADLGPAVLWDNYTSPPTSTTAQTIFVVFSGANVTGEDGWILATTDVYSALGGSFGLNGSVAANSSENTYFVPGQGFVGASLGSNGTNLSAIPGAPTFSLRAGPEPVGIAEQQYAAITANPAPAPFPILLVVALVGVAAVAAVAGVILLRRHAGRRPPSATSVPATGTPGVAESLPPAPGTPPPPMP